MGLLTSEQEQSLRRASSNLDRGEANLIVRTALGALGGGLLLAGLVLIVAENWAALPRFVKLGGWAGLQCAFLYLAHDLGARFKDRPYLAEAAAFVSGGWVLAGIALVSQIYHLNSRPANGVWFWLVLTLPAAWLLERHSTAVVLSVGLTAALVLEADTRGSWLYAPQSANPWLFVSIPILVSALSSCLPHRAVLIPGWVGAWVFFVSNVFLLVFGAAQELGRTTLDGAWILVTGGVLAALVWPRRCLPEVWGPVTSRLVPLLTLLPWCLMGSDYEKGALADSAAVGLSWIVQLGLAVLVIRAGARAGATGWVNVGYLALLAGILTRYFDFFGAYLEGGTALAATGVLILFVLYSLEKARRRSVSREVSA